MKQFKRYSIFLLVTLLALSITACGESNPTITLVENAWPASELNVAVAKIIIEQELGNTVEIVALDENAQWDAISGGDIDASLEVWPAGHGERIEEYINNLGTVENGGPLGPMGEIGWYVPTYVIEANPALVTWEGYREADAFSTAETGDKGRFLGGDPAYSREEPVLFYFYSPHAIFQRFDLTQVELPAYSDECYADEAAIDCAYPADELMKIFNADLAEKDADVHTFLSNMNYGGEAQVEMLATVDAGSSIEEAAQAWVDANESVWRAWLP
jgi:glycine betaine/proline transport system substrate-binding protein